jgi:hypothetical protein
VFVARALGGRAAGFEPSAWAGDFTQRSAADGCHMLLRIQGRTHQLFAAEPLEPGAPMAAVLQLDGDFRARAEAAWRFRRDAGGRQSCGARPKSDPRLDRIRLAIRAIDARASGASYRTLAGVLFGERRVEQEEWKTSSLRDATIRLARAGLQLMERGYLKLLRRKRE